MDLAQKSVTIRLRFLDAVAMVSRLFALVVAVLILQLVRRSAERAPEDWIVGFAVLAGANLLVVLMFRAVFSVTVTPQGLIMGLSRRPIEWAQISSVDHARVALGRHGFYLRSMERATTVVLDRIAADPQFRTALHVLAPQGHPVRRMLLDAPKT